MLNLLFVLISIVSASEGSQARPEIIFESRIEISDRENWTLGDFVTLKNHSAKLLEAVENHPVTGKTVSDGFNAQVIRQIYKELVSRHPGITEENPKLVLPQEIQIANQIGFSETYFRRKLSNYLYSQCQGCQITLEKVTSGTIPANQRWSVNWQEVKLAPSMLVPVIIDPSAPHWVSVSAKIKKNVLVSKRFLGYEERVTEEDFETKLMDVTFAKEDPVTLETLKTYQKTSRPMAKGKVVFSSDLKREPAAERGKVVKIVIGDTGFEVSISGVAEENGHVGDTIRVKNPDNKKIFSALIVEKGVVRVL